MSGLDLHLSDAALDALAAQVADRLGPRSGAVAFNVQQAAKACGLSAKTITRAIDRGELPASRVGTRWVVLRTDLEGWLAARRHIVPEAPRPSAPPAAEPVGSFRARLPQATNGRRQRKAARATRQRPRARPNRSNLMSTAHATPHVRT